MIGLIAGKILASGLTSSPKIARIATWVLLIALLVIVLGSAKCAYDAKIIGEHDVKVELDQAKQDRKADTRSAEQRRKDDARLTQEKQELKDVVSKTADPAERKRAFYRCIRLQREARQNGQQPPACS